MVMKLDQLVNGAINVGFGAAAVAVEGGKKVLDDLNTKGEQVRKDTATPDIARIAHQNVQPAETLVHSRGHLINGVEIPQIQRT